MLSNLPKASDTALSYGIAVLYSYIREVASRFREGGDTFVRTLCAILNRYHIEGAASFLRTILPCRTDTHGRRCDNSLAYSFDAEHAAAYAILAAHIPACLVPLGPSILDAFLRDPSSSFTVLQSVLPHVKGGDAYAPYMPHCVRFATQSVGLRRRVILSMLRKCVTGSPKCRSVIIQHPLWRDLACTATLLLGEPASLDTKVGQVPPTDRGWGALLRRRGASSKPSSLARLFSFRDYANNEAASQHHPSRREAVDAAAQLKTHRNLHQKLLLKKKLSDLGIEDYPAAFLCPITLEVMRDPVVASDGHTYERHALLKILQSPNSKSPLTREPLDSNIAIANINLKKRIREYDEEICSVAERVMKQTRLEDVPQSHLTPPMNTRHRRCALSVT